MSTKNIGIRSEVYERLKAHKRGDESFSEALDRILDDIDSDWRTHAGFLSEAEAEELDAEVRRGRDALDESVQELGEEVDAAFRKTESDQS